MPRFYFHAREKNGELTEDRRGLEFASPDVAHDEALKALREMFALALTKDGKPISFEVSADDGKVLFEVTPEEALTDGEISESLLERLNQLRVVT